MRYGGVNLRQFYIETWKEIENEGFETFKKINHIYFDKILNLMIFGFENSKKSESRKNNIYLEIYCLSKNKILCSIKTINVKKIFSTHIIDLKKFRKFKEYNMNLKLILTIGEKLEFEAFLINKKNKKFNLSVRDENNKIGSIFLFDFFKDLENKKFEILNISMKIKESFLLIAITFCVFG